MQQLIYSSSPHIKRPLTTKRIMIEVSIALLPVSIAACVLFGLPALWILLIATVVAVASELVFKLCQKQKFGDFWKAFDFTSVVTGMLIGLNMPAGVELYVPALASIFAIVIVKMLFGGTGKNMVNPAIAGRVFAFLSFGTMTQYVSPIYGGINGGSVSTGATNLGSILNPDSVTSTLSTLDLLLGTGVAGVIGETCRLAIIIGGVYLMIRGILNFRWPIVYIAVVGLVTVMLNGFNFALFLPSILSGGLILGAIFMATDYVTSPTSKWANYAYFAVLGILTAVLRQATGIEVVSFAILLMNLTVPLFDKYIRPRPFGYTKQPKVKEVK